MEVIHISHQFEEATFKFWNRKNLQEPIPLTWETRCRMWRGERKHQNTLSGVQARTTSLLYLR
ncbi:MAG: hypothetical protein CLLPBCKN_003209 [Chroococcidiopsis cubana SAG 39.79]|nr:hypothetical protein [Chroococcidiopsis cubana SAG 39.79]